MDQRKRRKTIQNNRTNNRQPNRTSNRQSTRTNKRQPTRTSKRQPKRKTPKNKGLGIGTFVYFIIFFYLAYNIISFLVSNDVNYISAEKGSIYSISKIFDGIILRDETVIKSSSKGIPSFYVPEGDKIDTDSIVCMVDSNGDFTSAIKENLNYINDKIAYANNCNSHDSIKTDLYTYTMNYNENSFNSIYDFKNSLNETLSTINQSQYVNNQMDLDTLRNKQLLESQINNNISLVKSIKSGVISYKIDGYEDFKIDTIDLKALFDYKAPEEIYTYKQENVEEGSPLFKIVNNDKWYIACEMDDNLTEFIQDKDSIAINIIDKDIDVVTKIYDIMEKGNKEYVILEIDRYFNLLSQRNISFQVVYKQYEGIKIPTTAITEKEFLKIPKSCIAKKGNNQGILKKVYGEDYVGGETVEFIKIGLNYTEGDNYYIPVSEEGVQLNDIIVNSSNEDYRITETKDLKGVYVINKGYTSFKLIDELYAEDRYIIVDSTTPYGIRIYDRVIADSTTIKEDVIVF
ncbi:hypothetical protein SH1V18_12770 [Vallitalea longa]|uniref:Membrane fusion protein n=1 Tax=Vallitalea longa TaxID=2936439 RepID=A0A9W5Y8J4_9FIRM|nr:HlyD family efflux transporter periplasmic adaptor subunit [Vallitalea longa]GKX28797.1 hypothetical protein SH1V18_12770 [Vallitalea longa]